VLSIHRKKRRLTSLKKDAEGQTQEPEKKKKTVKKKPRPLCSSLGAHFEKERSLETACRIGGERFSETGGGGGAPKPRCCMNIHKKTLCLIDLKGRRKEGTPGNVTEERKLRKKKGGLRKESRRKKAFQRHVRGYSFFQRREAQKTTKEKKKKKTTKKKIALEVKKKKKMLSTYHLKART